MNRKTIVAILCLAFSALLGAAEKNYLDNGDFSRLDSKKNLITWKVDAASSGTFQDGEKTVLKASSKLAYGKYTVFAGSGVDCVKMPLRKLEPQSNERTACPP